MFDKRISKYLDKIEKHEAISFSRFLALLPEELREEVEQKSVVKLQNKRQYVVVISCAGLMARLRELTVIPENRVEATIKGDSHKVNTSVSYLLAYHKGSNTVQPEIVISDRDKVNCLFEHNKHSIIVENSELFFAKDTLLEKMNLAFELDLSFENTDLLYGSGNQITNKLNKAFLNKYDTILCFFDYDFGGLKIFKAMKNMLGNKATFLEPQTEHLRQYFIMKPKNENQYLQTLNNAKELGLLSLYEHMSLALAFMEQEVILAFE